MEESLRLSDFAVELAARLEGQVPASRIEQITEVLNSAILNEDLLAARLDQYIAIGIPRHEHETMTTLEHERMLGGKGANQSIALARAGGTGTSGLDGSCLLLEYFVFFFLGMSHCRNLLGLVWLTK